MFSIVALGLYGLAAPRAKANDAEKTLTIDFALDAATYVQNDVNPSEGTNATTFCNLRITFHLKGGE